VFDGLRNLIKLFMALSVLFFVAGVVAQFYSAKKIYSAKKEVNPTISLTDSRQYGDLEPTLKTRHGDVQLRSENSSVTIGDGDMLVLMIFHGAAVAM
jgi:hypothetical protein